jgi:hypothetical protein
MRKCVRLTVRLSLAGALALLLGALFASTALASRADPEHTRYRFFQDTALTGTYPGQIAFAVLYEQNRKGIFTPREMVGYQLQVQASCNPGGMAEFGIGGNAFAKYSYFAVPLMNGQWSHRFESQFENPQTAPWHGELSGTVLKRLKRGGRVIRTARLDGSFDLQDWDPYGMTGVQENCISSGSYSATTCKRRMSPRSPNYDKWKRWRVPVCGLDPF